MKQKMNFSGRYWALWARAIFWLVPVLGSAATWADSVRLAAGEYAPFVGDKLADGGVTAAIVTAAFKAQGVAASITYLPWKRGFMEARRGEYVGTFPYLRTPEREVDFLYSKPIYSDQFRLFVRRDSDTEQNWSKKSVCVPLGYDTTQISAFTTAHGMFIEQPTEIASCFKMLLSSRVDAVWVSELVGVATIESIWKKDANIRMLDLILVGAVDYFLIVSRQLPNAAIWLNRFDAGLKRIKDNGTFQRIVNRYSQKTTVPAQP